MLRQASASAHGPSASVVLSRLKSCGRIEPAVEAELARWSGSLESVGPRSLCAGGEVRRRPSFIISGWAWRARLLPDGRRQVLNLLLPGDGFGHGLQPRCFDDVEVMALKPLRLMDAEWMLERGDAPWTAELRPLLSGLQLQEEQRLLDQIVRLGRQPAFERMAHLLLELYDRLRVVGLAFEGRFEMPLTQDALSDVLGLSVVHVNRTLQQLRRERLVTLTGGRVHIQDPKQLALLATYSGAVA